MIPVAAHAFAPDIRFDGGDLDCGGGLLLLIRRHIDPMPRGGLLEIRSRERSVEVGLPAWCRLTIETQIRAGADVLTDGEQRRDSYVSFVSGLSSRDKCSQPMHGFLGVRGLGR